MRIIARFRQVDPQPPRGSSARPFQSQAVGVRAMPRARHSTVMVVILSLAASACSVTGVDVYDAERDRLESARALWASQGIDSYNFVLRRLCFCAGGIEPATVVVRSSERVSVTVVSTGEPVAEQFQEYYLTVSELFAFIGDAIDREAHSIQVDYDAVLGHPTRIAIDYLENAIDEEMSFEASSLQPDR